MDFIEKSAKTVDEAITEALIELGTTSDNVDIEIIDKGSTGILGIFNTKPARVRVTKKLNIDNVAVNFLENVFSAMSLPVYVKANLNDNILDVELSGEDMGVLIGKRGQTLDSLQYLTSLVVNKNSKNYIRVKVDTENYRERRKETLENLARNLSMKVRKTRRPLTLEPMNPYERRIIHSVLQGDKYVKTHSEGEEPFRKVVITPKHN